MNTDLCSLRRQILKALQVAYPGTLTTDELVEGIPFILDNKRATIVSELKTMQSRGLVANRSQPDEAWWQITGAGTTQITKGTTQLDPYIWGRLASPA
jgi:hypothetical protein